MSSQDSDINIRAFEIYIFRTHYFVFLVVNGRITTFFGKFWPKLTVLMTSWEDIAKQYLKICFLKNSRYKHSQYTYFLCNIPKVLLWFLSFKWPTSSKNWGQPFAKREETSKKTTKFLHFPSKTPKLTV